MVSGDHLGFTRVMQAEGMNIVKDMTTSVLEGTTYITNHPVTEFFEGTGAGGELHLVSIGGKVQDTPAKMMLPLPWAMSQHLTLHLGQNQRGDGGMRVSPIQCSLVPQELDTQDQAHITLNGKTELVECNISRTFHWDRLVKPSLLIFPIDQCMAVVNSLIVDFLVDHVCRVCHSHLLTIPDLSTLESCYPHRLTVATDFTQTEHTFCLQISVKEVDASTAVKAVQLSMESIATQNIGQSLMDLWAVKQKRILCVFVLTADQLVMCTSLQTRKANQ